VRVEAGGCKVQKLSVQTSVGTTPLISSSYDSDSFALNEKTRTIQESIHYHTKLLKSAQNRPKCVVKSNFERFMTDSLKWAQKLPFYIIFYKIFSHFSLKVGIVRFLKKNRLLS
jgi:hypothetical protein